MAKRVIEGDIKGLKALRSEYVARLAKNPEYQALKKELKAKATSLVRDALRAKDISLRVASSFRAAANCGFCRDCITDCKSCVAYK